MCRDSWKLFVPQLEKRKCVLCQSRNRYLLTCVLFTAELLINLIVLRKSKTMASSRTCLNTTKRIATKATDRNKITQQRTTTLRIMTLRKNIKRLGSMQIHQSLFRTENVAGKSVSTRKSTRGRPSAEGATAKPAPVAIMQVRTLGLRLGSTGRSDSRVEYKKEITGRGRELFNIVDRQECILLCAPNQSFVVAA